MSMRKSTICLITSIVCFTAGVIIFGLALFTKMFDPKTAGGIGSILIFAFLFLSILTILLRNQERAEEGKKE